MNINQEDHTNDQVSPVVSRIKLTLHTQEPFFGPGVCELLEKIRETGSIQAAAAQMGMSYSKAWKILNRAEREMGINLIRRMSGGKNGGSSTLTRAGERAVHDFRTMEEKLTAAASVLLRTYYRSFSPGETADEQETEEQV